MRNTFLFILGAVVLIVPEFLRIYYIMPFPGSQVNDTIDRAYFLHQYIWLFRVAGLLLLAFPVYYFFLRGKLWQRIISGFFIAVLAVIFYMLNFVLQADKMFIQPQHKILSAAGTSKINGSNLVIGVSMNGEAKAYPIQLIGYHHQVQDTVGGTPVMVTYCTVCRTGRVYSPFIDGKYQHFRLVGMDHFNAMFEDQATGSWWRQENGEAITGKMKGKFLTEIPSQQMTLDAWLSRYPQTLVMQPDSDFNDAYNALTGFDNGTLEGDLEGTNKNSWQLKSWVIGIKVGDAARAYDWNDLKKKIIINDTLNKTPLLLVLENDSMTFHAWNREVNGEPLQFTWNDSLNALNDVGTKSELE